MTFTILTANGKYSIYIQKAAIKNLGPSLLSGQDITAWDKNNLLSEIILSLRKMHQNVGPVYT